MPNVDPEEKSQKTLKTEELEVLVRLLNSNLESLRYLQRESSIRDDVALNNRLLTARISALSGLITFMSEGELTQIRGSSALMHDTAKTTPSPRETDTSLGRPVRNLGLPVDDDEEGLADDESEYDDDDEDEDDDLEEEDGEEGDETAYPQPKETHSNIPSKPRPPIFQTIRPLMEVLRTGIQDVTPTTLHTNSKSSKPPLNHRPRNNHTNRSVTTTTTTTMWRSEYEMGDISSIDGKRRPVAGIPPPIRLVPKGGVLRGGQEPRRGNLIDLKRTRRPRFLPQTQTRVAGTPTADVPVPSSVNDVRYIPRKRPLDDDDGNLEEELVDKKRQRVSRSSSDLSMEPGPSRPTTPPRKTTSDWKAVRAKLSVEESNNMNTSMSACLVPASSSNDALILNPLLPTSTQIHKEPETEMSNSSLPFTSPPSLHMQPSASDSAIVASGTDNTETDMDETSCILS